MMSGFGGINGVSGVREMNRMSGFNGVRGMGGVDNFMALDFYENGGLGSNLSNLKANSGGNLSLNHANLHGSRLSSNLSQAQQDAALREQTDAFEAFLIKEVLDISMKNENSLFPKDAGEKIYSSMYNDTMSKALSGGLGFSEMLFNFLKERI